MTQKWVYLFNEGSKDMRDLLGGKGAGLAEMTNAGLPVPSGFTITTDVCNEFVKAGNTIPADADPEALYTAVLAKIGAQPIFYRTDHTNDWQPDLDHIRTLITPKTRALVVIDPNNPTGARLTADELDAIASIADRHGPQTAHHA